MRTSVHPFEWFAVALLAASAGWVMFRLPPPGSAASPAWPEAACLCFLCTALVMAHCRSLPCQNVLFASTVLAAMAATAELVLRWLGFPLLDPGPTAAPKLFGLLSWPVPVLWVSGLLLARGVSRALLQRTAGSRNYGLRVLGSTIFFFLLFQIGLHTFTAAKTGSDSPNAAGTLVWFRILAGCTFALLILLVVTPLLLEKKPVKSTVCRVPIFAWNLMNLIFLAAAALSRAWLQFGLLALTLAAVNLAAWQTRPSARPSPS